MSQVKSRLTKELKETFPDGFLWGASVSSHQVEGDTYNQWTRWELETAKDSAKLAPSRWSKLPIWNQVAREAINPDNYISGHGDKHYKLYKQDFEIAKRLGLNSFRFNLEWSRIEPEEGTYSLEALQHYKRYIKAAIEAGLTPIVGLWHWTNPVWFENKGGFTKKANLKYWRLFVEKVADELDWSEVRYASTINEANSYSLASYFTGEFPPGRRNILAAALVYWNLSLAHRVGYSTLTKRHPHLSVGVVHQIVNFKPKNSSKYLDRLMSKLSGQVINWWFLRRCHDFDFIGLNYYRTEYVKWFKTEGINPQEPVNDLGWYMNPAGLEEVIEEVWRRFNRPIIITENGVADLEDKHRLWWLTESMHAISNASRHGVDVRGYHHWSLLDNFEWQYGWFPKFGLVAVDRQSYKRNVKKSAKAWANWLLHG